MRIYESIATVKAFLQPPAQILGHGLIEMILTLQNLIFIMKYFKSACNMTLNRKCELTFINQEA